MTRAATLSATASAIGPATVVCWLLIAALFIGLRFDNTDRIYFPADDNLVVTLVDDIVSTGNWQPDWYRARDKIQQNDYFVMEGKRTDLPHAHHYNFTGQILLGAALTKTARTLGSDTPTVTLLHHLAFFLDGLSLLLVISCARRLSDSDSGKQQLAFCAAITYSVFPLAVQGSHYARPDALLTAMGSAVLWLSLHYGRMKNSAWIIAMATTLAAAIIGKASQVMLGIYPALALLNSLVSGHRYRLQQAWTAVLIHGSALSVTLLALIALVFSSVDISVDDFVISTLSVMNYYAEPAPPDVLAHYTYFTQLGNILHYFYATLGAPLLAMIVLGSAVLLQQSLQQSLQKPLQQSLQSESGRWFVFTLLCLPLLLFLAYFASVRAFFDRSFCASAAPIVLLAAIGITQLANSLGKALPAAIIAPVLALLCNYQPILINYHLHTDHLYEHHNDDRLAFQQNLKDRYPGFWFKNVDRANLFSRTLPAKAPKNPRIYVVEDFNDWNSAAYAQLLRDNGFVQVAEFEGDFHAIPTSSLLTVHEAARFRYFIRQEELPPTTRP